MPIELHPCVFVAAIFATVHPAVTVTHPGGLDALAARAVEARVGAAEAAEPGPADVGALVTAVFAVRSASVTLPRGLDALAARASEARVVTDKVAVIICGREIEQL